MSRMRWAGWRAGLLGAALAVVGAGGVRAQDADPFFAAPGGLFGGDLVFHGNYCGPGDRGPGARPVDALDRACMHHDRCTPVGGVASCACNARLRDEAALVSRDPRQPDDLRSLAGAVVAGALLLPCRGR